MSAKHALSFIKDPWLKITPPIEFNDPYELTGRASKRYDKGFGTKILEDKGARMTAANLLNRAFELKLKHDDLPRIAKHEPGLWQRMTRWYVWVKATEFALEFPRIASVWHGVACFSEDPRNRLMWAHYADRFRGLVIGFNTLNAFFRDVPLKRVVYTGQRVIFPHLSSERCSPQKKRRNSDRRFVNLLSGMDGLLLTKHPDFKYEKEWRLAVLLAHCRKRLQNRFFRRVPRACISEVIIGPRCAVVAQAVRTARRYAPQALVQKLNIDLSSYELNLGVSGRSKPATSGRIKPSHFEVR